MLPQFGTAACPVKTHLPCSMHEAGNPGEAHPDIRAYKLGKKRWSYNQVELRLAEAGGPRWAAIKQTAHAADVEFPEPSQNSAVCFHVQLESGHKLQAHLYVVYDLQPPEAKQERDEQQQQDGRYSWKLVTRGDCCKGCQGNVLRSLQRFGRLGKRSWNDDGSTATHASSAMKDPRFMYLSLDEACTHVDATTFRLVAGIYNGTGTRLLSTAVSPPIRVLANNDVPTGAARIPLEVRLPANWEGWGAALPPAAPEQLPGSPEAPVAVRLKRTCSGAVRDSGGGSDAKPEPSSSTASISEENQGNGTPGSAFEVAAALPQAVSAPVGLAFRGMNTSPAAPGAAGGLSLQHLDHSNSLTVPGEQQGQPTTKVVAVSSPWQQQQQQQLALVGSGGAPGPSGPPAAGFAGPGSGTATRSFSLPAQPCTSMQLMLQSHWQARQQAMAQQLQRPPSGGGPPGGNGNGCGSGATPFAAAATRTFSLPDPSSCLPLGHFGQMSVPAQAFQPGSPRSASLPVDGGQAFALLASQQSGGAGVLPQLPSVGPKQQQAQQAEWARFCFQPMLSPVGSNASTLPMSIMQQLAAAGYHLPQQLSMQAAVSNLNLSGACSGPYVPANSSSGTADGQPGPAFASDPAAIAAAAAAEWLGRAHSVNSPTAPQVSQQVPPLHCTGSTSNIPLGSHPSGSGGPSTTNGTAIKDLDEQREAARHAALLQHAEAQMLAASRAAASRASFAPPGFTDQQAAHLQMQQLQMQIQMQQRQQQQLAATAAMQMSFKPAATASMPALQLNVSAGMNMNGAFFPGGMLMPAATAAADHLRFGMAPPLSGFDHMEMAALLDDVLGAP